MNKSIELILNENNIHNQLSIEQLLLTDWKNQFNKEQLEEIYLGLFKNVDVSIYANSKFNAKQMEQIRYGLENKLDVSIYTNSNLNMRTMRKIRLNLLKNFS